MKNIKHLLSGVLFAALICAGTEIFAQDIKGKDAEPVELNGDSIEYKPEEGKFVASGNVYLKQNNAVLFCDKLEFFRDKKEAHAEGNIILESDQGTLWAEKAFYNFDTKKGEFTNARLMADPIYGRARSIVKVRENYYIMNEGYLTTSDYDVPEYRVASKTMDVIPGDKAVARNSVLYLGQTPVMYFPKYTQDLSGKRPHFSVIPGYKREFGTYLLTAYRTALTDRIETTYHVDWRELKGVAGGVDAKYDSSPYGKGLVRTYYMNERNEKPLDGLSAGHHQRYRVEWRHKYDLDPSTTFISQYYKETDAAFLKKYFPREYRSDSNPPTYALLTHTTPKTTTSLRADVRVNRFESTVERLPEAAFSLSDQQLGDTGFYFKSGNTAAHLVKKDPSPSSIMDHTVRLDTDNEVSRPFKIAFLEVRPYIGAEDTYYSRTFYREDDNSVRHIYKTGSDVSTKFYRIYDVNFKKYGIEVNRLRHVITPTVGYSYQHRPTLRSDKLFAYDGVDARATVDKFSLGLENKLQTKQEGLNVDLFRALLTTDFRLKDNRSVSTSGNTMTDQLTGRSYGDVTLATDLTPNKYVSFYSDATYDNDVHHLRTANFDTYINSHRNWALDLSRRYTHDDDDIVTARLEYKLTPKWRTAIYQSWNVDSGARQESQYAFVRDLHSWEVEFAVKDRTKYEDGSHEFWIIFRIKAFPSLSTGGDTVFNHIARGSAGL
jgi:LPS-assembly protein